uniref:WKF domain-containing protein n=1 Tax=Pectinophora gossypiella TaxID=13191 RepID=A0A1E1WTG0_PECGO
MMRHLRGRKRRRSHFQNKQRTKKGKKSIRQMKREKFLQRQAEEQAAAKDQLKSQCLSYLSQWKHDKQNWKFMKAKQVWLYKNKFSSTLLPDASWPLLLEYFESAKGNIRNMLLEDAHKVIKKMDEWTEAQSGKDKKEEEAEDSDTEESNKPDSTSYKRARDLIQCLEE